MSTGKSEACKTYIEQTKLLVTLSSAFLVAPPFVLSHSLSGLPTPLADLKLFFAAEFLFIGSILAGYIVLATIAGSQDDESFDVFRTATRVSSLLQLFLYLGGLFSFVFLVLKTVHV